MEKSQNILMYFADPMCSWCWGFTPVIDTIKKQFGDAFKIGLVMGGLRPGTTQAVTDEFRQEIFQHWRHVNELSGQPFTFTNAMPDGFVYDTEPPSRAVVAVGELEPELVLTYYKSIQYAFYVEQQDVTQQPVLARLATNLSIDEQQFLQHFNSEFVKQKTQAHFYQTRQYGVKGFPTLIMQGTEPALLTHGYCSFADLRPKLEAWLSTPGN